MHNSYRTHGRAAAAFPRRRGLAIGLPLLLGTALSVGACYCVRSWEHDRWRAEFDRRATLLAKTLERCLDDVAEIAYSIDAFYGASREVEAEEFATFTEPLLANFPPLETLAWAPRIAAAQLPALEEYARRQGEAAFVVQEWTPNHELAAAAPRAEYFPLLWVAPHERGAREIGVDETTDVVRWTALHRAMQTHRVEVVSPGVETRSADADHAVSLVLPIYGYGTPPKFEKRPEELSGFVLATVQMPALVQRATADTNIAGVEFQLYDSPARAAAGLVYDGRSNQRGHTNDERGLESVVHPVVWHAARQQPWLLVCTSTAAYLAQCSTWESWTTLVGGLLATASLGAYLRSIANRRAHVEQLVTVRTAELAEALRAAEVANRAKTEFLANMSHEIRTPMTAILGFAETLVPEEVPSQERITAVETIIRNGRHLLSILNDILDLSKIEAGHLSIECVACSPVQIVAEVESLMRARSAEKGLNLAFEYQGAIPELIRSDPLRLRQILINLVGNAVKFTTAGEVRLITSLADADSLTPRLQFDIVDSGPGLSAEQAAGLFRPFSQADASTTRMHGGTGLGLAISRRLAVALGGDVRLVETAPGVGSRFRVVIEAGPLAGVKLLDDPRSALERAGRATRKAPAEDTPAVLRGRILLAEDGPDNRRLIAHVLEQAGAVVTAVDNGRLAADAALAAQTSGCPFDVILMDMQMPVMDGYAATRLLRKLGYTRPILALTAHAMSDDRQKCLAAGCDDFASKPIQRGELLRQVGAWITRAESHVYQPPVEVPV